ncbi:SIR2 family protein [Nitrosomonas oligotropha]|uniref:SIR2-like domain-containing protein n=1 Tax=Nitrosomonas oligotropha TaxID=42354 RepID=A0A1H8T5H8_9PROT|nr:SIR2 family protein [Nitrosomonas oligotropha]SDX21936.1 SIR2-like domain-containing protein [Nitrosomonas oligotropha]SEO86217.1 SIR2-like domain-containing protein [Nitrosomonas oligotropha]
MADLQDQNIEYLDAIDLLKKQCRVRPIVPFLGAGISLPSGYPSISAIVEYLSKVDFAIQHAVYSHRYPGIETPKNEVAREYQAHPSRFLRDFGWPRIGQLDSDLWEWLDRIPDSKPNSLVNSDALLKHAKGKIELIVECDDNATLGIGLKRLLIRDAQLISDQEQYRSRQIASRILLESSRPELLDLLSRDILPSYYRFRTIPPTNTSQNEITKFIITPVVAAESKTTAILDLRDHLRAIVQWGLRKDLRLREKGTSKAALREWLLWKKWYAAIQDAPDTQPELLYGDWESLLDRLCEGDFDLVDSLFTSFGEARSPTTAHRYLTFLRSSVDIPLILTTNFDNLLEQAFRDSGIVPKVFDIHRDADLPDAELVRRSFSLLKLHGSSYGLRLGEGLRNPLEQDAQADVLRYLPENALIVVLGFSGSERRIMQLLQAIATSSAIPNLRRILWLKGPGTISVTLRQMLHECHQSVYICEIDDAGAFLQDWYFAYSQGYQSSPVSYTALGGLPIRSDTGELARSVEFHQTELRCELRKPIQLFIHDITDEQNQLASSCTTLAAGDFVAYLGYQYHPIWIDLESHHTVSGVVSELFDYFRTYDPDASRIAIVDSVEGDVPDDILQKTVDRIGEMLGRGRYVIVFDALESFGRTQMMHHGIPTYELLQKVDSTRHDTLVEEFRTRVNALHRFLVKLLCPSTMNTPSTNNDEIMRFFRDSYIVLAVNKEQPRQLSTELGDCPTLGVMKNIRESLSYLTSNSCLHVHKTLVKAGNPPLALNKVWDVRTATQTAKGLEERVASILLLKQAISRYAKHSEKDSNPIDELKSAALVAVLSVFRRPLSIPVVRSLTERWFLPETESFIASTSIPNPSGTIQDAHNYVDKLLRSLQKNHNIVIHQGGRIRLEKSIHELFYGGLTSDLHVGNVILKWKERYANDACRRARVIIQGALSASLHFAAARTMYVDVFLLTQDVQAFYEYLYHRVAVLRILMVMCAILRLPIIEGRETSHIAVNDEVCVILTRIYNRLNNPSQASSDSSEYPDVLQWFLNSIGLTSVVNPNDEQSACFDLASYVQKLRLHALQTLSLAIGRSERLLRSDASPDTLIGWAHQFNQREESDITGEVFEIAHNAMPGEFGANDCIGAALKELMLPEEALQAMKTIVEFFNRIAGESYFVKMDFLSVLETELRRRNLNIKDLVNTNFPDRAQKLHGLITNIFAELNSQIKNTDTSEVPEKDVRQWLYPARALSHLGWYDLVIVVCKWAENALKVTSATENDSKRRIRVRRILRDFTELEVKARLGKECLPWHGLFKPWPHNGSPELNPIENLAVRYETMLRETSRDTFEDTRHRSSAYVLRARVLYLQGRFRTAHRYLDLAACGSSAANVEHAISHAAIHLARAELLVHSSHLHLTQYDEKFRLDLHVSDLEQSPDGSFCPLEDEINELAKETNKIRRAESEVQRAGSLLDHARHQTIWSLRVHMGAAQITFERLLFDLEKLIRSKVKIEGNTFAKLSGELEQSVLNGLRHLRSALDLLPFITEKWSNIHESLVEHCPSVENERKIYAIWLHLYVISRFYWEVLRIGHQMDISNNDVNAIGYINTQNRAKTVDYVITQVSGKPGPGQGEITWQMWSKSLRFNKFAEQLNLHQLIRNAIDDVYRQTEGESFMTFSAAPLRLAILDICSKISNNQNLNLMWNIRRGKDNPNDPAR